MGMFLGIVFMMLSLALIGTTAYLKKSGSPALMGLFGFLGLAGVVVAFIPGLSFVVFMPVFPLSLILVAIIGIQKVRA